MAVKNTDSTTVKLADLGSLGAAFILVLLPFHALFTTWLGSNFGHLDAFRIWKELLAFALAGLAIGLLVRTKNGRFITGDNLLLLMLAYAVLHILLAVVAGLRHQVNASAMIYGLLANLRFFGFFATILVFARYSGWLRQHWPKLVFGPALLVVTFGLLQLVLPNNFLSHFGYGPSTIPAFQLVDQKNAYIRLQSTLRGANPLGAYLVVMLSLAAAAMVRFKKTRQSLGLLFAAGVLVLVLTYSRSAIVGLAVSLFALLWLVTRSARWRQYLLVVGVIGALIVGVGVWAARDNNLVQNTVFHTDETTRSDESSNEARARSLENGWEDVLRQPLGSGPGTAGLASVRNNHPARIAENYYLQIGQEVGILGMGLFILINIMVGIRLFVARRSALAIGLLVGLIGLTLVNLLSHAWADDTLGMLWWGLAGIALAQPVILNKKRKRFNAQTKEKPTT